MKIKHGGNLREAAKRYNTPWEQWLDLSTGINPRPWQPPEIPLSVWQRLPEDNDDLLAVAKSYYKTDSLLAVAGSQEAIQILPTLRPTCRVGVISPCYAEHEYCWRKAGHEVVAIDFDEVDSYLPELDVLLLVNPNNPDARLISTATLCRWHQILQRKQGWLVVDEAFMDASSEFSLLDHNLIPVGMVVLRSIGKFFGLAGIRLGFVAAERQLLEQIENKLNPWHISHPARWIGGLALADRGWQQDTRLYLQQRSREMQLCLFDAGFTGFTSTANFVFVEHENSTCLQAELAKYGIWVRLFPELNALRFGLVNDISRLRVALGGLTKELNR